jgi:hypothetical protein
LDVWKLFLELLSHENIGVQIATGLGAAFVAVMVLEGIRASFFPKRILEGAALRSPAPPVPSSPAAATPLSVVAPVQEVEDMRAAWTPEPAPEPVLYTPLPRATVNADLKRRSSPRRMRVIGQRKPI